LEQNYENFHIRGRFSKKQKLLLKILGLASSGRHNSALSAVITNAENSRLSGPRAGCLISIFTSVRVIAIIVRLSVRVRVCVCVTRRHFIKTAKRGITQITPRDSPGTLVGGRPPFPLKFALKVTHPLFNSTISTNISS